MRRNGISVTMYSSRERKSISITVYTDDITTVARMVERELRRRWPTTSLDDKRHKRR